MSTATFLPATPNALAEHADLLEISDELLDVLRDLSTPVHNLDLRLRRFCRQLREQFCLEECEGLFHGIRFAFPHLAEIASRCEREHARLSAEMGGLAEAARRNDLTNDDRLELAASFALFHTRLLEHERSEHTLLYLAYSQDLGTKD